MYNLGRPYSDYPELVALHVKAGTYCGETNHSKEFPAKFLKSLAAEIKDKINNELGTILDQTGNKRPVQIIADKDTKKHRTRQLVCLTTVFPSANQLIQTLYIDHPLIRHHKAIYIADNILIYVKQFTN